MDLESKGYPFLAVSWTLDAGGLAAQQHELIQNAQSRAGVNLSGPWRTIIDPYNSGYLNYHEQPLAHGGFGANRKPASARDLIEYSFDT
jgi:beta-glucuronidase